MKTLYFFLLVLISSSAFSQLSSYNIADYLYPDVQRKTLMLRPFVDFNNTNNSLLGDFAFFGARVDLFGSDFINSRKRQLRLAYNLELGFTTRSDNHPIQTGQDGLFGGVSVDLVNRYFFKPKRFFEIDISGSLDYNDASTSTQSPVFRNELVADLSVAPKIGFGRLEFVTDAWLALTILEELQNAGCLSKDLDHNEITLLAEKVSELRNYRHVDFRLENIYEFEQLATYLINEGYMDAENYKSFAILKDAYDFEGFVIRENGQQFTVGLELDINYINENFSAPRTRLLNTIAPIAVYERKKAISSDWQFDQRYELRAGIWRFSPLDTEMVDRLNFIRFNSVHTVGYYLSQRTNFEVDLNILYRLIDGDFQNQTFFSATLIPRYNYYISPNLRLFANGFLSLVDLGDDAFGSSTNVNSSLQAGINYFFY